MNNPTNPLRQYFRRPTIYLKLPSSGISYSSDILDMPESGELPVYPMTAIDEITTKTPDALYNGDAIAELIKSCVPNIKKPYEITSVDFDAILIAIKTATQGNDYDVESVCPKCSETTSYKVNLVSLLSQIQPPDYDATLKLNELEFKFRPLVYREMNEVNLNQFEVQRVFMDIENSQTDKEKLEKSQIALKMVTELTMKVITKTVEYIKTPELIVTEEEHILDYLQNCDKTTYIKIRDYNAELKNSTVLKPLKIVCPACNNNYEQSIVINATDFFV